MTPIPEADAALTVLPLNFGTSREGSMQSLIMFPVELSIDADHHPDDAPLHSLEEELKNMLEDSSTKLSVSVVYTKKNCSQISHNTHWMTEERTSLLHVPFQGLRERYQKERIEKLKFKELWQVILGEGYF
jgi:hypothetical protein